MLLTSMRALCRAPGGVASIWKYEEALVRATGVSGRFDYGFLSDLHFADNVVEETDLDSFDELANGIIKYAW